MIKELRLIKIEPGKILQISQIFSVPTNKNSEAVLKWRLMYPFIFYHISLSFFEGEKFQTKVADSIKIHI
jgi:hypothetical protein